MTSSAIREPVSPRITESLLCRRSLMKKYKIGELVEADRVQSKNAFAPQWSNDQPQEQGKCVVA